jgi:threonine/homoserine/homoserine lactone efflux protein
MEFSILLRGLIIGFSIAAPVGPIGVLCIRRTLAEGRLAGFVSGLGAATADAVYGSIAAFGLTLITSFLLQQSFWLRAVGGIFLLYLGIKTFISKPEPVVELTNSAGTRQNLFGDYASTFFLTLTNPLTILSFAGIFAGLGLGSNTYGNYLSAITLVLGVFFGSATWWFILSGITSLFHKKMSSQLMLWVNRISGAIIILFGILALVSLVQRP